MLASVSQVRDDAAHAQCVEARRFGGATTACAPVSNKTATGTADKCTKNVLGTLYSGSFTFGTDQPAYPPWYMGDNPASGMGTGALQRRTGPWAKDVRRQPV